MFKFIFIDILLVNALLLLLCLGICGVLESFWPSKSNQSKFRSGLGTDLLYWFLLGFVDQVTNIITIVATMIPIYLLLGRSLEWESIQQGYGVMSHLPLWLQGVIWIVLSDFIGYWMHRSLFHNGALWKYHAIHHCSEEVDWLSSIRNHPVNSAINRIGKAFPLVLLGLSPLCVKFYLILLTVYAALTHANLSWSYGPFQSWLVSPVFHRSHHSAIGKGHNFASLFPLFDILFGTFYMPEEGQQPDLLGLGDEKISNNLIDQFLYPFLFRKDSETRAELVDAQESMV